MNLEIRRIDAAQTYALRHAVLRSHQPPHMAIYDGDDETTTAHFGAFVEEGIVGIVTLFHAAAPFEFEGESLQLRGMAVAPEFQNRGVGAQLVQHALEWASSTKAELIWCNARTSAVPFYAKFGFETRGEEFLAVENIPHFVMFKTL
jgi:GNAT superfamily N-acetyltransferase